MIDGEINYKLEKRLKKEIQITWSCDWPCLLSTGIGQLKYRNLTLFHVIWSVPEKVFLTLTVRKFNQSCPPHAEHSLTSAGPPLTIIFAGRNTLNDLVSFGPFLQEDWNYKRRNIDLYIVAGDPKDFSIKYDVAGHVTQL